MSVDEVPTVLDVHPPHEPVHGWRDFVLHLVTITIGLLIALSLEGLVEWQHHRHLVHEAEASLHDEIANNAKGLAEVQSSLHKQQADLKHDVEVLKKFMKDPHLKGQEMAINYEIKGFQSVSWKTTQSTGAFAYMSYDRAQDYAEIYNGQDLLFQAEQQAGRDAIISLAPFMNSTDSDPDPTPEQSDAVKQKIEVLQGQLQLVDSIVTSLDKTYKKFLAAHPD